MVRNDVVIFVFSVVVSFSGSDFSDLGVYRWFWWFVGYGDVVIFIFLAVIFSFPVVIFSLTVVIFR